MAISLPVDMTDLKPKLLDQVRDVIRRKHYNFRTEQASCDWRVKISRLKRGAHAPSRAAVGASAEGLV